LRRPDIVADRTDLRDDREVVGFTAESVGGDGVKFLSKAGVFLVLLGDGIIASFEFGDVARSALVRMRAESDGSKLVLVRAVTSVLADLDVVNISAGVHTLSSVVVDFVARVGGIGDQVFDLGSFPVVILNPASRAGCDTEIVNKDSDCLTASGFCLGDLTNNLCACC